MSKNDRPIKSDNAGPSELKVRDALADVLNTFSPQTAAETLVLENARRALLAVDSGFKKHFNKPYKLK